MSDNPEYIQERLLRQIADRRTTRSFKRTLNTAILLRVARGSSMWPAVPRKARYVATLLGLAGLLVSQHMESLRTLLHLP
jgi:hypothetical protein